MVECRICVYSVVFLHIVHLTFITGARGSVVVKALCYKPEGREFDSR
jgi:hypothetical protein